MEKFKLFVYDDKGAIADMTEIEVNCVSTAKTRAGYVARERKVPVDVVYAESAQRSWKDAYVTTAFPSSQHVMGYFHFRIREQGPRRGKKIYKTKIKSNPNQARLPI